MKIGVMSDSHDHIGNLREAIRVMKDQGVEAAIHCGDFCSPFIVAMMKDLDVPAYGVFGNVDGDKYRMMERKPSNLTLYGELAELNLGGKRIAIVHYPEFAEALARTGKYDVVFHGHTHVRRVERMGSTLVVNPGELMNLKGRPSFVIYDTETNEVKVFEI